MTRGMVGEPTWELEGENPRVVCCIYQMLKRALMQDSLDLHF